MENALKYYINTQVWSKEENINIFYFSSFDESWKVGADREVGPIGVYGIKRRT